MTPVQLRDNYPDNDIALAAGELQVATAIRQHESPAQLYERMVEFWSDHFNAPSPRRSWCCSRWSRTER